MTSSPFVTPMLAKAHLNELVPLFVTAYLDLNLFLINSLNFFLRPVLIHLDFIVFFVHQLLSLEY